MLLRHLALQFTFLAFLTVTLYGQQENHQMKYQRMEGSNDTSDMKANFIRQADRVTGNFEVTTGNDTNIYEMAGNIDHNNHTTLSPFGTEIPALEGIFTDQKFTGMWNDGVIHGKIELTETYPPGSIPLEVFYLRSEENLVAGNPESPTAEIELTMLYPVSGSHITDETTGKIRHIIAAQYTDKKDLQNPDSILMAAEDDFYSLYKEMDSIDWQDMGAAFSWTQENNMSVIYNSNHILSLEYLNYVYTGGAHGMTAIRYDIIDLQTGKKLTYDQIFKPDSEDLLSGLLTQQLRNDKGIPDSISLEDAGYFVDKIEVSDNIYVNGNGIGFTFGSYEIAPYSMGITQILLPYSQIKNILRKNSPVWELAEL